MKRILITGAGGFVGPYLIKELQNQDQTDIYASVYSSTSDIATLISKDHIFPGDLTDYSYCEKLIQATQPDIIYHLAAISVVHHAVESDAKVLTSNTLINYNLLEAVKNHAKNARFVAVCSANVYGQVEPHEVPITESQPLRPLNVYAVSKLSQEFLTLEQVLSNGLDAVILRPFNHTGPGQTDNFVIPAFAKQFAEIGRGENPPEIKVGNLDTARDFTDVRDMVRAYVLAGDKGIKGEVYNIGSGISSTIGQILDLMQELSGTKVEIKVEEDRVRTSDVPILLSDSTKFKNLTGWSPQISFRQTLSDVLEYYRNK